MKFAEFKAQAAADMASSLTIELPKALAQLQDELAATLDGPVTLRSIEMQIAQRSDQTVYRLMSEWMQRTATRVPEICPACDGPLEHVQRDVEREFILKTGQVRVPCAVGWCSHCQQWRCPTEEALGRPKAATPIVLPPPPAS